MLQVIQRRDKEQECNTKATGPSSSLSESQASSTSTELIYRFTNTVSYVSNTIQRFVSFLLVILPTQNKPRRSFSMRLVGVQWEPKFRNS